MGCCDYQSGQSMVFFISDIRMSDSMSQQKITVGLIVHSLIIRFDVTLLLS
jgi:hypothetical protein